LVSDSVAVHMIARGAKRVNKLIDRQRIAGR